MSEIAAGERSSANLLVIAEEYEAAGQNGRAAEVAAKLSASSSKARLQARLGQVARGGGAAAGARAHTASLPAPQ